MGLGANNVSKVSTLSSGIMDLQQDHRDYVLHVRTKHTTVIFRMNLEKYRGWGLCLSLMHGPRYI